VFRAFSSTGFSFADFSLRFGFALRGDYERSSPITFGTIPTTHKLFTTQPCLCYTVPPRPAHQFPTNPRLLRVPPRIPRLRPVIRSSSTSSSVIFRPRSHPLSAVRPLLVPRSPRPRFQFTVRPRLQFPLLLPPPRHSHCRPQIQPKHISRD
jgi:hypothetical protein